MARLRRPIPAMVLQFLLALALLNIFLTAFSWAHSGEVLEALAPSAETLALLSLLALNAAWVRRRWRSVISVFFILAAALLILVSCAEALVRFFYDRQLVVADDIRYIPGGLYLLFGKVDRIIGLLTATTIILMAVFGLGSAWLIHRNLWRPLTCATERGISGRANGASKAPPATRITLTVLSLLILPVAAFSFSQNAIFETNETGFDKSLTRVVVRAFALQNDTTEFREVIITESGTEVGEAAPEAGSGSAGLLPGLRGSDVHLFFVESYGQIIFTVPELSEALVPLIEEIEGNLEQRGYTIASSYITSPVVGGYSWIAEAAFLTGQDIRDQSDYDELITRDLSSMPRMFAESGYRTVLSMPGTVHGDWPEASTFYKFGESMFGSDFGYRGPMFSFVPIPDQYALAKTHERLLSAAGSENEQRPAFIQYVLVSSHAPYNRIPPYIDDWKSLDDGSLFNDLEIRTFDNGWVRGTQYAEGYIAAMEYVLTTLGRYLTAVVADPGLVILVGDHQPPRPLRPPTATKSVPINILSRDSMLVDQFLDEGFVPGLIPDPGRPSTKMSGFFGLFARIATASGSPE